MKKVVGGNLRKKCWRSTKWSARQEHTKEEVSRRSGGWPRESTNVSLDNGVKAAGQESFRGSGIRFAAKARHAGEPDGKGHGAAAKDEGRDRYDKNNSIRRQSGRDRSWWVSELLAADCPKAWLHPGRKDTMLQCYNWLYEKKKKQKDEEKRMEVEHQKLVRRMIKCADGGAGFLHKITQPTA